MNKRMRVKLEFARRKYDVIPTEDMLERVKELEATLNEEKDIWSDDSNDDKFDKIKRLDLSDRRLMIVFSILDCSVVKTAKYFGVDRSTISDNIKRIKDIVCC